MLLGGYHCTILRGTTWDTTRTTMTIAWTDFEQTREDD